MLNMRHIQTIRRPARRANRRQSQRRNNIARNPMVLVYRLGIVQAAVQLRYIVLREAHQRLDVHEHVERQAQARVRRFEVFVARAGFVHFDDDKACGEGGCAEDVEEEVYESACAFLRGGVCGLEDKGGLDGEEEACGVEELHLVNSYSLFREDEGWGRGRGRGRGNVPDAPRRISTSC